MTRVLFPLIFLVMLAAAVCAAESAAASGGAVSASRRDALVAALLHWPEKNTARVAHARPSRRLRTVRSLTRTMTRECGYSPTAMLQTLSIPDENQARVARTFRQLDRLRGVTRPGNVDPTPGRPDALLCAAIVASVYAPPDEHGTRAVSHLAELCDDDVDAAATGRVMYHLLARVLADPKASPQSHVRMAAKEAQVDRVARRVRAARTRLWAEFPAAKDRTAALERIVRIWQLAKDADDAWTLAEEHLPSSSARQALACLLAVSHGAGGLPQQSIWDAAADPATSSLRASLTTLARRGPRLPVDLHRDGARPEKPADRVVVSADPRYGDALTGTEAQEADAFMASLEEAGPPKPTTAQTAARRQATTGAVATFLQLLPQASRKPSPQEQHASDSFFGPELPEPPVRPVRPEAAASDAVDRTERRQP